MLRASCHVSNQHFFVAYAFIAKAAAVNTPKTAILRGKAGQACQNCAPFSPAPYVMHIDLLLSLIEVAATIAFALSGLIEATRKRMDIIGVLSVTFVSAFGGGTLRDVLLDRRPLFWVQHQEYVWLVLAMTLVAPLLLRAARHEIGDKLMEFADALGLGLFTISGASIALAAGMPPVIAILMGSLTAVFGGVSRDVLCNEIPKVFHDHRPYTMCTFIGCGIFLGLRELQLAPQLSTILGIVSITGLRLLALAQHWHIPPWPPEKR